MGAAERVGAGWDEVALESLWLLGWVRVRRIGVLVRLGVLFVLLRRPLPILRRIHAARGRPCGQG